jgi:hypothetical protein
VIGAKDRPSWIPVFGKSGFASCRATSKNPPVLQSGLSLPITPKRRSVRRDPMRQLLFFFSIIPTTCPQPWLFTTAS